MIRPQIALIGPNDTNTTPELRDCASEIGHGLVKAGYRIVCGGMGGVMKAVCQGAKGSPYYFEGSIIGILPGNDGKEGNRFLDIIINSGVGFARNLAVVSSGDIVIALGGGAGTLSELAFAWQFGKTIVAIDIGEGWSQRLGGFSLDNRRDDAIHSVASAKEAVELCKRLLQEDSC